MFSEKRNQPDEMAAWPVSPRFLVKSIIPKYVRYSPNKHGIYASDTVRGLLADASDDPKIQNPLSLFQVVSESCDFEDFPYMDSIVPAKDDSYLASILEGKKIIRIDPNYLYKNKTCCDAFRSCNGYERKCHEQDCRIALLYHGELDKIDYNNNFDAFYSKLSQIIEEYNEKYARDFPLHCERDDDANKLYVWYQCPYSNFYEYFFPIIHSGKVIAVLMQGQRIPENLDRKNVFQSVVQDSGIYKSMKNNLIASICSIPDEDFGKTPIDKVRLNAIWKRINTLEERVNDEVLAYSRAYVYDNLHRIEDEFHHQIKDEIKQHGTLTDEAYKKILNGALRKTCYVFNKTGFIRIYSTEYKFEEKNTNTDTFYLIGTSSELSDTEKSSYEKIVFHNLPSNLEVIERMNGEAFLPYLKHKIKFHEGSIFRI